MFTIYSKNNCPYCTWAKELLTKNNILYDEYNIEENREFLDDLVGKLGYRPKTVPQIWDGAKHIGGYTELTEHLGVK